jgi:hypothetical protein
MKKIITLAVVGMILLLLASCENSLTDNSKMSQEYEINEMLNPMVGLPELETQEDSPIIKPKEETTPKLSEIHHVSELSGLSTRGENIPTYGTNWRLIVEPVFHYAVPFVQINNGTAIVSWYDEHGNPQSGNINAAGYFVELPPPAQPSSMGAERGNVGARRIREQVGDVWLEGAADAETGQIIIEPVNAQVWPLCEYLIAVMPQGELLICGWIGEYVWGKWGLYDMYGREIIPPTFTHLASFSPGIVAVTFSEIPFAHFRFDFPTDLLWGLINRYGETILPIEHCYIETWTRHELRRVNTGGTWDWAIGMQAGAYTEIIGGRWGFLNRNGTWAVPQEIPFDWVDWRGHCENGIIMIEHNRRLGFIQLSLPENYMYKQKHPPNC